MTMLEVIKIIYLNKEKGDFLKYEILADETGKATLALAHISLQHQVGLLSYAVWTKVDEIILPAEKMTGQTAGETLQLAVDMCVKHRAEWQQQI
ncbi:hypothetical protein ACMGGR_15560 [Erwinia sp. BNK-24-b]|uniref:hypothetical protein n=1 Tax=unclassified Erwinia TaxID=2622719 RepID=UPI0039BFB4FE